MTGRGIEDLLWQIRDAAIEEHWLVLRDNKMEQWKNRLLACVSDEVVNKHLRCLQPFQLFRWDIHSGVYEFKTNWYSQDIYLKVNINTFEVLSFHYDELPFDGMGKIAPVRVEELQVIVESSRTGHFAWFAVGSNIIKAPVYPVFHEDGTTWISADEYDNVLEFAAKGVQKQILRRLECFDKGQISALLGSSRDYGVLSYSEGQLQLISICYDLWCKYPGERWIQDTTLDLILRQSEKVQKKFAEQLHGNVPLLPNSQSL